MHKIKVPGENGELTEIEIPTAEDFAPILAAADSMKAVTESVKALEEKSKAQEEEKEKEKEGADKEKEGVDKEKEGVDKDKVEKTPDEIFDERRAAEKKEAVDKKVEKLITEKTGGNAELAEMMKIKIAGFKDPADIDDVDGLIENAYQLLEKDEDAAEHIAALDTDGQDKAPDAGAPNSYGLNDVDSMKQFGLTPEDFKNHG